MPEIDSIILKYLQGKTSEEENQQLYSWTQQSLENKKRLFAEKDILDTYAFQTDHKKYNIASELELLKKRLSPKKRAFYSEDPASLCFDGLFKSARGAFGPK